MWSRNEREVKKMHWHGFTSSLARPRAFCRYIRAVPGTRAFFMQIVPYATSDTANNKLFELLLNTAKDQGRHARQERQPRQQQQ